MGDTTSSMSEVQESFRQSPDTTYPDPRSGMDEARWSDPKSTQLTGTLLQHECHFHGRRSEFNLFFDRIFRIATDPACRRQCTSRRPAVFESLNRTRVAF